LEKVEVMKWDEVSVFGVLLRKWVVMDLQGLGWLTGRFAQ